MRLGHIVQKMNDRPILPRTEEERNAMRLHPEKPIQFPAYSSQKKGIKWYILILLLFSVIFVIGVVMEGITGIFYLYFLFTFMFTASQVLNIFAVMEGGILCGKGFIPWHRIRSFSFKVIDINHRFYGFAKEVNGRYELNIETKFSTVRCIVANEQVKEQMESILEEKIK